MKILDLLAPNFCIICGKPSVLLPDFPGFCRCCLQDLPWRFGRQKIKWANVPEGQNKSRSPGTLSAYADSQQNKFFFVYIACSYQHPISHQLLRLKFHGCTGLAEPLAALGYQAVRKDQADFDAVMAVPLHESRLRERGYNQARLISEQLAGRMGCPDLSDLLVRHKATGRQSEQSGRIGRISNLCHAFSLNHNSSGQAAVKQVLAGRRILLVDDVMTTGATLRSAALPLIAAGAEISALAIASDLQEVLH